ncbi:MAG: hypothetical protein O7F16_07590, partial [Acidobacteria bacterium]|nr:hypothetical protein [Acidobacteriota bacterium]
MIFEVGAYLLTLALGVTAWSVVAAGLGSYSRSASLQESAERGVVIISVLLPKNAGRFVRSGPV